MKTLRSNYLSIFFITFFALWCIRELWLVHYLNLFDPVTRSFISASIKIIIWVIPVLLLVYFVEKKNPISFLSLNTNLKKGFKWAVSITFAMAIYFIIVNMFLMKKEFNLNLGLNVWLNHIILVGIIEEIVFRGFLLKKFMEKHRFGKANVYTSLLFVTIHLPIWFRTGLFHIPTILGTLLFVFLLSLVFGFIYKRTDSLWSVIIIHSFYDFFVSVFAY